MDKPVLSRPAERAFEDLIARGPAIQDRLDRSAPQVDLAWPVEAMLGYDGGLVGYFLPALEDDYVVDLGRHGHAVRVLGAANGIVGTRVPRLGDDALLTLVRSIATWLSALHAESVVLGNLSQRSVAFSLDPMRIRPLDYDTARVVGRGSLLSPEQTAETSQGRAPIAASYDGDRFLFATLAFQLLVARTDEGSIKPSEVPPQVVGLSTRTTSRLRTLWHRAAGPLGTRPAVDEWVAAFSHE